jgi:hypothetical protein
MIAMIAIGGAFADMLLFLIVFSFTLPPEDGGRFGDRLTFMIGLPICLVGALLAFFLSFHWIRCRDPMRCAALVCGVTGLSTIIGTLIDARAGLISAFVALILASEFCALSRWSWLALRPTPR